MAILPGLAIKAAKNPKKTVGLGMKILLAVALLLVFVIVMITSIFSGMNGTEEKSSIDEIYQKYNSEVRDQKLKEMGEAYQADHAEEKVIIVRYTYPPDFIMAYLMAEYPELQDQKNASTFKASEKEIYKFLDYATVYTTEKKADAYYITSDIHPVNKLKNFFFNPFKKRDFVYYYELISNNVDMKPEKDEKELSEFVKSLYPTLAGDVPHYLQYDERWAMLKIMGNNIKTSGCSITSLAMVVSYFHQKEIFPSDVREWAWAGGTNPYYVAPYGASWQIFPDAAAKYDLTMKNLGLDITAVVEELRNGRIVIMSCNPGLFTSFGHFIVLRGIDENGKILVNDPNDSQTKDFYNKAFEPSFMAQQAANFWSFWKEGFMPVNDEILNAAKIVVLEAGYQDRDAQIAVAEVMRNRLESSQFPNTYTEIIFAPYQFTTVAIIDTANPGPEVIQLVKEVFSGKLSILNNKNCLFFCSKGFYASRGQFDSFWGRMKLVATYGNHFFAP